jgi:hypothetical protein
MARSSHVLSTLLSCGVVLVAVLACKGGKKDDPVPDPANSVAASDTASAATPTVETARAPEKPKATTMTASPTTDRVHRNRDKDLPCPPGFTEQPGAEQFSTCARNCKTDSDCHGHKCDDSEVGDGKVCSEEQVQATAKVPAGQSMSFDSKGAPCPAGYAQGSMDNPGTCRKACKTAKDCAKDYGCRDDHFCYFDD